MKLKLNKKQTSLALVMVLGSFLLANFAQASWVVDVLGWIFAAIVYCLGQILILVMKALIYVAQYSDFIHSPAVTKGWVIARDICNMFFVLILLIIAFATILNIEKYSYKKYLPKLILMAILINFSKTICGLLIDVAQVIMLTFVNAFKTVGGANLTDMLGINNWMKLKNEEIDDAAWTILGAYALAVIYVIVALIVLITMLMMLVMRIVMIWIYVVLSPFAYLLASFPGGQSYSSKWWSDFTKNLVVGPVIAFFIWLSFATVSANSTGTGSSGVLPVDGATMSETNNDPNNIQDQDGFGSGDILIKFIISIGMLVAGMKISQEIGGAAGSMAGKGMNALNKGAKIGVGGLAAVTGYRYASGVMKKYQAERKAKREERYTLGASKLASAVGKTKQGIAYVPNKVGGAIKKKTWGRAGVRAEEMSKSANLDREKIREWQSNVKRKEGAVGGWKYNKDQDAWVNKRSKGKQTLTNDEMQEMVQKKTGSMNKTIETKEQEASRLRKRQARIDKGMKYGLIASAALTGGLTAGGGLMLGLAGAGLAGGAAKEVPQLGKKIKKDSDIDLNIASNFRAKMLSESKDKMKHESNDRIIATMDDASQSPFVRAAAALEAMDRKILSLDQAQRKKEEIRSSFGGADKKTGEWKDKKLGSYVEGSLEKNYIGATKVFEDLNSDDSGKKEKARRTIMDRYEQGVYSLDLDTGTLEKSMGMLTTALKTGAFVKQFDSLKDSTKKDAIVEALKKENSFAAKEKLSRVRDLDTAFGNDNEGKMKALGNMGFDDLQDVFRKPGTIKAQDAIKKTITDSGRDRDGKINIFTTAKNELLSGHSAAESMLTKLGIS